MEFAGGALRLLAERGTAALSLSSRVHKPFHHAGEDGARDEDDKDCEAEFEEGTKHLILLTN